MKIIGSRFVWAASLSISLGLITVPSASVCTPAVVVLVLCESTLVRASKFELLNMGEEGPLRIPANTIGSRIK